MNIKQHSQQDPNSFYAERWADGYMVYHGRSYCFSYSITRAKARLVELGELTKNFVLVEWRTDIERGSELVTSVETYQSFSLRGMGGEIQFTTMYPAQNNPKLFALRKRRLLFADYRHRLEYEAMFDFEILVLD